jgi:hypothetical protein
VNTAIIANLDRVKSGNKNPLKKIKSIKFIKLKEK